MASRNLAHAFSSRGVGLFGEDSISNDACAAVSQMAQDIELITSLKQQQRRKDEADDNHIKQLKTGQSVSFSEGRVRPLRQGRQGAD